ncbi:MAG: response regulator [Bacteroidetes bacterium]|nr:response regulator [Bacteroidota bacterium]
MCNKNIEFEVISDISIPTIIVADQNRIIQVINNLISNAVKFTDEGKVSLKAKLLSKDFVRNEIEIKVEVIDSGQGISKEKQKHLFVPFSQIDQSDIRNIDGAGLGLSICKEIVDRHGGQIGYETEINKGSTFWFTFKAGLVNAADYGESNFVEDSFRLEKSLNILFVEDKATTQKVVKLILNSMGHNVVTADNGKQAIEGYKHGEFDLILMDIQMPVMDGVTATQKLKQMYKDIPPIVALSANAFEGAREKYIKLGMDEYLTKPLDDEEFKDVVKKLV